MNPLAIPKLQELEKLVAQLLQKARDRASRDMTLVELDAYRLASGCVQEGIDWFDKTHHQY